ncbi:YhgE/Pip domain-containing protein [Metabacillus malikii]|uniref:X-X-X-Leu-X-X-Gly heptad repeat protein n=1 Tax=Metabacillus malikii TaxID=1504265 RepID=A0ABT9ZNG8_9BACI|nr:YhgE/Pip domain-containing protein [Metabacillus malikii]MDQ0233464.1 X-X-X-Leu-X-X-Gly heptad repeat protein [Metabacillus malikii]
MRKKQLLIVPLAFLLLTPSVLVTAAPNESTSTESSEGELSSKDEVVYATLHANGELDNIYVVNNLEVKKAGTILDYGNYDSLKNLTDLSTLEQQGEAVQIDAPKGKFYYQGNMDEKNDLPWDISISYLLDGKEIAPEDLAGKDGHFQIKITTTKNENANQIFYENYLLQISLTLDSERFLNIHAQDGMIANAGKNKQVTFTVMPETEKELSLKADVANFEFQGIEIAAVPSSTPIDAPNIDEMTKEMSTLTKAISEVNNGVGKLKTGVGDLNTGVVTLRDGSTQYKNGLNEISGASAEIVTASQSINKGLTDISNNLKNSDEINISELQNLPKGLTQIADGLTETVNGLSALRKNYTTALNALDKAMKAIPEYEISEEELTGLYQSGADKAVLDKLTATYKAALTAKGTYTKVNEGFQAVDTTLKELSVPLTEMATSLTSISSGLSTSLESMDITESLTALQEGMTTLSTNYEKFHTGLVSYTEGVGQLSTSYQELHAGINELAGGTGELAKGVSELHDGTNELYTETSNLPDQMQEEIDAMLDDFDKSDFEAVSFVSPNNENVNSVQFVIKTESIKLEEQETKEVKEEKEKGFWTRLFDLFS